MDLEYESGEVIGSEELIALLKSGMLTDEEREAIARVVNKRWAERPREGQDVQGTD